MAYDPARHEVVMFGSRQPSSALGDTWTYSTDFPAALVDLGGGCPGAAGTAGLAPDPGSLPWIGDSLSLAVRPLGGAVQATTGLVGSGSSNLDLTGIGMPGCVLRTTIDVPIVLDPRGGSATWVLPIPSITALAGQSVYLQSVIVEPGANPLGVLLSDATQAVFGIR